MNFDLIIHNGTILTVNPAFDILENGIVGIRQGRLARVAAKTDDSPLPRAAKTIDAAGGIIMPGLVNTHTHLPMTLFRGLADDMALDVWLHEHIFPAEARYLTPAAVRWGSLLAVAEMLLAGTTCCCDGYFLEDTVAETLAETGIAPVPALLSADITVGLGSDGCASNNDLNLFHEMGTAARLHKALTGQPTVMDAATVVKMATIEGATTIGLAHQTGSLETGKQADVIVIDTRRPHMTPMYHPESHVVYAADAADVRHVVVAGRLLVAEGKPTGLDLGEIMARVNKIAFKIRTGDAT